MRLISPSRSSRKKATRKARLTQSFRQAAGRLQKIWVIRVRRETPIA
jgi:hypothetical protein